ncbi:AAA family ATPase [Spirosoma sp. KUDC1026]|uniref:AAA family ATPase n=1 Tax=Spirosoma sp. KUDC1026 TaxID=2745947 RepID=UPI00159B8BCD|nr:AAA family ATPase [Spirosoma sp. KUDC1026]QKZ12341.1 AAA family ATPase [Spirosoma sp. KUDC1026]
MEIEIPHRALVLLIGVSSAGKSSFARRHFKSTQIVSSDHYRAVLTDDENDQTVTGDAFRLVRIIVEKRLQRGLLTVIDATNLKATDRREYLDMARQYGVIAIALVFRLPASVLNGRHQARPDRNFSADILQRQIEMMPILDRNLPFEGFQAIYTLDSPDEIEQTVIHQKASRTDGPFDIIGDVHGCYEELLELLAKLGYEAATFQSPTGRKIVFVGDLVDRGPDSVAVLRLVMQLVDQGKALAVLGNHDDKLRRKLLGRNVDMTHGLAETIAQLDAEPPAFRQQVLTFLERTPYYIRLDNKRLIVAHAGLREDLQGRSGESVRAFCLFGETTGEVDAQGLPVRINWASSYQGKAVVVYGHTPVSEPVWINNAIDVDTGCVFGGKLTALRYPERQLVSVPAKQTYAVARRPFLTL